MNRPSKSSSDPFPHMDFMMGSYLPVEFWNGADPNLEMSHQNIQPDPSCESEKNNASVLLELFVITVLLFVSGLSFMALTTKLAEAWTITVQRSADSHHSPTSKDF